MRPLSQTRSNQGLSTRSRILSGHLSRTIVLFTLGLSLAACASGPGSGSTPPPPTPQITVTVAPNSGTVLLGNTLAFSASVNNTSDTSVFWSVNGISGGSPQVGTISPDGLFTAPTDLPPGGKVQVTATSHADSSKSSTAGVTVSSDIAISLSPVSSSVELGSLQSFHATITSSGKPDPAIRWSLSGTACPNNCGVIDVNGNYTAPAILPTAPSVTLTATSVADLSRQNSTTLTITSHFTLQLAAPSSLQPGVTSAIIATLTPVPGSSPSGVLSWSLSGSGCSGSACGILSVITTQSAGGGAIADTANYTAPATAPQPSTILITVTPQADPSKQTQVTIVIQGSPSLSLSPSTATLAANHRLTLTVTENGAAGSSFAWSVNGISGGNSTAGQLCVVASSPCQSITSGTATQVDYIAPGAIPSTNPVSVQVAIAGNPATFSSAQITVINHILVSVFPASVTLPPLGVQGFTASVLGTGNQAVVWQVQGSACSVSGACGSITPSGTFTAPAAQPAPNTIQIVAISQDDSMQSGAASVTLFSGSNILSLHPASVYAGGANGFTLTVDGSGFVPSNPGPGSTLSIAGAARVTTCTSTNSCSAPVNSTDVVQPGNVSVQLQNPSGTLSNIVSLVVATPGTTDDVISLTSSAPSVAGKNIPVVEPTTAGVDNSSVSFDLNVAAIGIFNTSTNACNLAGNPIPLLRPASGTIAADICLFSQSGFDTSMAYTISGPGDVAVISKQPAGLGIIHLTIQIPSTAQPGARTLFIQNANLDKTAASGVLEIQ
ncbi:MAG TPA: hypothetical protein VNU20_10820 [Candidatus Sulfotelmatobacter sp.]|jgi:hypothetical protein|nr:hypothetical protein [Candidatus Sulfotelmatobacter sp.]